MKWKGWLALVALLITVATPLQGQGDPGQITGTVSDETGAPLSGATVSVAGTALGALTGADGGFTISGVPAGSHQLRVTHLGYSQVERTVSVAAGQSEAHHVFFPIPQRDLTLLPGVEQNPGY